MKKICSLLLLILVPLFSSSSISFHSFRKDTGVLLSRSSADWEGDYRFLSINDSTQVVIDNIRGIITVGDEDYEFLLVPRTWNTKTTFRNIMYECIELSSLEKVFIYLIQYDRTENYRLMVIHLARATTEVYNLWRK